MGMNESVEDNEYDDRILLDTFGEVAKQFLTQKVIPKTDAECKWDWRYVRCEHFCECEFLSRRSDYHLGRSCCRRDKEDCDPVKSAPEAKHLQLMIQRMVQGSQKVVSTVGKKTRTGYEKVQNNVCSRLPELTCSEELPVLAWQEHLLCRNKIPDCSQTTDGEMLTQASQTDENNENS
jgi:hypothetical protein